jgi:hypothetical protein
LDDELPDITLEMTGPQLKAIAMRPLMAMVFFAIVRRQVHGMSQSSYDKIGNISPNLFSGSQDHRNKTFLKADVARYFCEELLRVGLIKKTLPDHARQANIWTVPGLRY